MKNLSPKNDQQQRGAVLVMALLMLFVLTLIGVSSINTTTLEEKMSGNSRNRSLAFQAAETAVHEAEDFITSSVNSPNTQFKNGGGSFGLYTLGNGPSSSEAVNKTWWSSHPSTTYAGTTQDIKTPPKYTIEYLGENKTTNVNIFGGKNPFGSQGAINSFRITVRGTGLTDNSVVVIQTHFGKRI